MRQTRPEGSYNGTNRYLEHHMGKEGSERFEMHPADVRALQAAGWTLKDGRWMAPSYATATQSDGVPMPRGDVTLFGGVTGWSEVGRAHSDEQMRRYGDARAASALAEAKGEQVGAAGAQTRYDGFVTFDLGGGAGCITVADVDAPALANRLRALNGAAMEPQHGEAKQQGIALQWSEVRRLADVAVREAGEGPMPQDWQDAALKVCRAVLAGAMAAANPYSGQGLLEEAWLNGYEGRPTQATPGSAYAKAYVEGVNAATRAGATGEQQPAQMNNTGLLQEALDALARLVCEPDHMGYRERARGVLAKGLEARFTGA